MNNNQDYNNRSEGRPLIPTPDISQRTIVAMNIYDLVQASGLSQAEIAKRAGISKSTLSAYVTGKNYPRAEQLAALARVLGVPVSAITGDLNTRAGQSEVPQDVQQLLGIYQQLPTELRRMVVDVAQTILNGYNAQRY